MKKNYFLLVLFVLLSNYTFSQTKTVEAVSIKNPDKAEIKNTAPQTTGNTPTANKPVFEKTPLPPKQKVSPAIFYVENDKPVDRLKYQQSLQQKSHKK